MTPAQRLRAFAQQAWPYAFMAAALWVVRYWHSGSFGLYEDDLTHLPVAAAMTWPEVLRFAFDPARIVGLLGQGHPLHYTFIYVFTRLGWQVAGLHGLYALGFLIEALNACLFYALLRRVHSHALGLLGGLAYVLFAADTTQAYLTYSLGLQPALTFLLLAAHTYLSGRRWLAYPLAGLILLTYETPFTVFLALPLLAPSGTRSRTRELARHALIMGLMLAGMFGWRMAVGDDRIGALSMVEVVTLPLTHMLQGVPVSLGSYLFRPVQAIQFMTLEVLAVSVVAGVITFGFLTRLALDEPAGLKETVRRLRGRMKGAWRSVRIWKMATSELPDSVRSLVRILLAGLAMLALAYPLTYTVRAYAITGRDTRVHAAGVVGAAVVMGAAALLMQWWVRNSSHRRGLSVLLACWMGLLAGYGFVIQRDYQSAWRNQQRFWSALVTQIPDSKEGTVILVEPGPLGDVRQIGANTWNLPFVLEQLYAFPPEWRTPPRVVRLQPDWREHILSGEGPLQLDWRSVYAAPFAWGEVEGKDVILFLDEGGVQVRQSGPMDIAGQMTSLMTSAERGEPPYPHRLLYGLMILPAGAD